ncbi:MULTISPECIES: hypothetical protein [unclassified Streptomyces]|uniref:hypothetical protein n=1 Tax=unclassified Streptomyces TaxID=2593676 RepID=UPI0018F71F8E|nr:MULTISPECIES: hypothetical protein [unclassified Streptomyces]
MLRDDVDNLMLLCAQQYMEIDAKAALGPERVTTVVRMVGPVHGNAVELSRETAANAVMADHRFPLCLEFYTRHGVEIDLRHTPGEQTAAGWDAEPAAGASCHYYQHDPEAIRRWHELVLA